MNEFIRTLRFAVPGILLGVALHAVGFTNFDELHEMFSLEDPRLFLTFAVAVAVTAVAVHTARPKARARLPRGPVHPGIVPGAALFGVGWALTGGCPGVVFAQIGEGQLLALISLAGVFAGNWIYGVVHRRFFEWDTGSCDIG
ncbi:DUF6691 family protein [Pseudenhygromyxa sp. WMMC2535]|uniref:DUF6691 family protein n=1 Tax=Pseudenhygromyxa sp. WMMC2535 TaxID=2712867 RepID=UPI0020D09714|nr:DUF6691 family protein [Pseudenhygromyxa sp. WMMC2535]